MATENSWQEYKRLVMGDLERLDGNIIGLTEEIKGMREDIIMLKVKASVFGALAGLFTGSIGTVIGMVIANS